MAVELDKFLQVRAPGKLLEQLDEAAGRLQIDRSDFVRLVLNERLRADGIGTNCWDVAVWAPPLQAGGSDS